MDLASDATFFWAFRLDLIFVRPMTARALGLVLIAFPISSSNSSSSTASGPRGGFWRRTTTDVTSASTKREPRVMRLMMMISSMTDRSGKASAAASGAPGRSSAVSANVVRWADRQMKGPGVGLRGGFYSGVGGEKGGVGDKSEARVYIVSH